MATIGERLTEARKNLGLDIRSAAEATKIRSDFLAALEKNEPESIKLADVYKVGFLRIYAKYLRLDADRIVAEFRTALSFHTASGKGAHRPFSDDSAAGTSVSGMDKSGVFAEDGNGGAALLSAFFRSGGKRLAAVAVAVVVALAVVIFGAMKIFGGNDEVPAALVAVETPTPDTQQYEFQIVSKIAQTVTIEDRYGAADSGRSVLLDKVALSPNRAIVRVGRGVLEIRDAGGSNLEIRFPSRAALLASKNARETVKLTDGDKSEENRPFKNDGNWWTADPYLETR